MRFIRLVLIWSTIMLSCFIVVAKEQAGFKGYWQGEIGMGDHSHPLSLDISAKGNDEFRIEYEFWGMLFTDYEGRKDKGSAVTISGNTIHLLLHEAGIKIEGKIESESEVTGTVSWMGLEQPMTLKKIAKPNSSEYENMQHKDKMNVAILVFDGVDTLDWAGPLEVFDYAHVFNTFLVAAEKQPLNGGAYKVVPNYSFEDMPHADIIVIPGGDIAHLFLDDKISNWLKKKSRDAQQLLSVCNASTLLVANNLLSGLKVTTHAAWMNWLDMMSEYYNFTVENRGRFVDNGKIITTAGVSSGIDGALHLVAKLKGLKHAQMTAEMMEYKWIPEATYN